MTGGLMEQLSVGVASFTHPRGGDVAQLYKDAPQDARMLFERTASASPYLARLLEAEHLWLQEAGKDTPVGILKALLAPVPQMDLERVGAELRERKKRIALLTALCDLGDVWTLADVTGALSAFADFAIETGLRAAQAAAMDRGKLPMCSSGDLDAGCGMFVLGMGKLGAHELNYSSDIDLIVLFDETRFVPDDHAGARKAFIGVTQTLVKLIGSVTDHGYVFRTDLRLRPDPAVTPVCISTAAAEQYYESLGRTWERAAMIKARPVAGDIAAGEAFLKRLHPFVWRRHLDFAAVAEAQDMLLKIRSHKQLFDPRAFEGLDIKLGHGGIRQIEFFAQTHQLIYGGREEPLRVRGTCAALAALVEAGRIEADVGRELTGHYAAHRALEHRIQMLEDAQTHHIPKSDEARQAVAALCGFSDPSLLEADVMSRVAEVHGLTEIVPSPSHVRVSEPPQDELANEFEQREDFWLTLPALRHERAREIYQNIKPALLARFAGVDPPQTALARFETFLSGLPAGVQLFSLFENSPALLDLLVDICAISPALAEYLGRNAAVFDAVLDRDFFEPLEDAEALLEEAGELLEASGDYEARLDALRRWQREVHFRVGVHLLRGIITPQMAGECYSRIADTCVQVLMPHVEAHLSARFGPAPGRGAAVLAMGKLGSKDMTASSDLDLIVIYDAGGQMETDGPRAIASGTYYARFTQTLISALTVPTAEGALYEVDLRLRPSGRKGPVATSLSAFAAYQKDEAWTWEHLALTRARVVSGGADLRRDVERAISAALTKPRKTEETLGDIAQMRARLAEAHDGRHALWPLKHGEGRLLDMELLIQGGAILVGAEHGRSARELLEVLCGSGWISNADAQALGRAHDALSDLQQIARLVGGEFDPENAAKRLQSLVCDLMGLGDVTQLRPHLEELTSTAKNIIERRLAR